MNTKKKLAVVCGALLMTITMGAQTAVEPDKTGMEQDALDWTREVVMGWNLGNSLECPKSETEWGNPRNTREMIHAVRETGFNAIRIPVRWINHVTDESTMVIDPT